MRHQQGDRDPGPAPPARRAPTPPQPTEAQLGRPSRDRRPQPAAARPGRLGLLVTPSTILRWHRELVARRWTTKPARPGRPAVPAGLRSDSRAEIDVLARGWARMIRFPQT
jgi:hypothetical protein